MTDEIKIKSVKLQPLRYKHYVTEVCVDLEVDGWTYDFKVEVGGFAPNPSPRELEGGWEPDQGMDHVESEAHLFLAHKICEALEGLKGQNNE